MTQTSRLAPRRSSARSTVPWSLALLLLGCVGCGSSGPPERPRERFNVVLISLDTLRADHLSAYGYERSTSPVLEALAADGVLFEQFVQNGGGTLPSHMTMLTSLYPLTHEINPRTGRRLPAARETLAERLHAAGYHTAAFTDAGWVRGKFGFSQGFDIFDQAGGHLETILPKAERFLERNADRPFFLFLHTYDIHSRETGHPYSCPGDPHREFLDEAEDIEACRGELCGTALLQWANGEVVSGRARAEDLFAPHEVEALRARYDGCIRYADTQVGRLLERLRSLDLYDRTLLIVTSDHGEEFLEHGLFLHRRGGYEELAHLPLILKLPYSSVRGARVPHLAAMVDLMPTVLEVVGVDGPVDQMQGRSLMPAVLQGTPIRQATHLHRVLRTERYKYFGQREKRLFDLSRDRREQHNLIGEVEPDPRLLRQLEELVAADYRRRDQLAASEERTEEVTLSDQEIRELKALGYLE